MRIVRRQILTMIYLAVKTAKLVIIHRLSLIIDHSVRRTHALDRTHREAVSVIGSCTEVNIIMTLIQIENLILILAYGCSSQESYLTVSRPSVIKIVCAT